MEKVSFVCVDFISNILYLSISTMLGCVAKHNANK